MWSNDTLRPHTRHLAWWFNPYVGIADEEVRVHGAFNLPIAIVQQDVLQLH